MGKVVHHRHRLAGAQVGVAHCAAGVGGALSQRAGKAGDHADAGLHGARFLLAALGEGKDFFGQAFLLQRLVARVLNHLADVRRLDGQRDIVLAHATQHPAQRGALVVEALDGFVQRAAGQRPGFGHGLLGPVAQAGAQLVQRPQPRRIHTGQQPTGAHHAQTSQPPGRAWRAGHPQQAAGGQHHKAMNAHDAP